MSLGSSYSVERSASGPQPARSLPPPRSATPRAVLLLAAALCYLIALGATCAVFLGTRSGQWLDGLLLPRAERGGGYEQQTVLVGPAKTVLAAFGSPSLLAVLLGGVLLVGLLGRRLLAGAVGIGMVLGTVGVAGILKELLPRPDFQIESSTTHNSFPSGHVAAATALLLAFMLVLPGWARRWLTAPGAVGVSVIASATMIAGWHRFSDVLGGVLLAVALFCLAAAALAARPGAGDPRGGTVPGGAPDRGTAPGGASDSAAVWRAVTEGAVGLIVAVWVLVTVAPGLRASVDSGPLVAIVAATGSTVLAVGSAVFLARSVDSGAPRSITTAPISMEG
ncbi:phosphatase PAP2 family protein [Micromonospora vulcania]|uniref:Phosphatase PAP2 family protein n=1 Tax=Micromonospora vulcania TaxID=1441873 RepID=A0ABW1HEY2_9ACTN